MKKKGVLVCNSAWEGKGSVGEGGAWGESINVPHLKHTRLRHSIAGSSTLNTYMPCRAVHTHAGTGRARCFNSFSFF